MTDSDLSVFLSSLFPANNSESQYSQFLSTYDLTAFGSPAMPSTKPLRLPPNFTEDRFSEFFSCAEELRGHESIRILSSEDELVDGDYMNPCKAHVMHAIYDRDFFVASAVICPEDVPNVQDIVRLANEFCMPLWPYAAGRNTGCGGTALRVSGSIALDLGTHMNKVLDVNIDGAFALVEPGVTFMQLARLS